MGADGSDTDRPARLGRRTFVKGLGAAGAATVGLSVDNGFAQDAEAIAPLIGAAVVGTSIGVGWALREFEVLGSDAPPEGLTPDTLKQQIHQTAKTRKSTNSSTIVDNRNILDGVKNTAYTEAKIAAIEELNAGSTESAVLDAATAAIDTYETTIVSNLFKSWNEGVNEVRAMLDNVIAHSDVSLSEVVHGQPDGNGEFTFRSATLMPQTKTLPDGTTMDVYDVELYYKRETDFYNTVVLSLFNPSTTGNDMFPDYNTDKLLIWDVDGGDGNQIPMLRTGSGPKSWKGIYDEMSTRFQTVRDGISTWVTNVYGDVQSGDIEIDDLVTPRERAAMMSDSEMSQAVADLIALNIPVDARREAEITINDSGATMSGTFALTDSSDGPLEAGTTYDPSTMSGDVYFTTDVSLLEGDWTGYQDGVDGGNVTLTSEPYSNTTVELETAANETVQVDAGNWTATGNGTWYHDVSPELETDITSITSARFFSSREETNFDTIQLQGPFTVEKITNKETGEDVTATSFSNSEPQSDSNYITQEEWDDLEQQNKELIERYEEAASGGGGLDLGQFDMFGIPGEMVAVGVAALVGLGVLGNN